MTLLERGLDSSSGLGFVVCLQPGQMSSPSLSASRIVEGLCGIAEQV
jgi:hypothetical protein